MAILGCLFVFNLVVCCLLNVVCKMNFLDLLVMGRNSFRSSLSLLIPAKPNQMHHQYANRSDFSLGLKRSKATSMQRCNKWDTNSSVVWTAYCTKDKDHQRSYCLGASVCRSFRNPIVLKDWYLVQVVLQNGNFLLDMWDWPSVSLRDSPNQVQGNEWVRHGLAPMATTHIIRFVRRNGKSEWQSY